MTTLRLNNRQKIFMGIMGVISCALLTFGVCMLSPMTTTDFLGSFSGTLRWLYATIILEGLLLFAMFVRQWRTFIKYRIEFGETMISENVNLRPFFKPFRCSYDEILYVGKYWRGIVEIGLASGKYMRIAVKTIDGGKERVLEALERHIPADRFEAGFKANLMRSTRKEKATWIIFATLMALFLMMPPYNELFLQLFGWNVFARWGLEDVRGYSIGSGDSVWVVTETMADTATARYYSGSKQISMTLPRAKTSISYHDVLIFGDELGNPTIVTDDVNYFWDNGKWEEWKFPEGYDVAPWRSNVSVSDKAWLILWAKDKPNILVKIEGGTGEVKEIPLPNSAVEKGYKPYGLSLAPDGTILVLAGDKESAIYLLNDEKWLEGYYPLESPELYVAWDFTTGPKSNIYALLLSPLNESFIRKFNESGYQDTFLPPTSEDIANYYISADARGRLWLFGNFPASAYVIEPVWGGTAKKIVVYNEYNSNFDLGHDIKPWLAPDGKIWTAGSKLIWVDSAVENLPNPAPLWVEKMARYTRESYWVLSILGFAFMLFALILNRPIGKKR